MRGLSPWLTLLYCFHAPGMTRTSGLLMSVTMTSKRSQKAITVSRSTIQDFVTSIALRAFSRVFALRKAEVKKPN